MNTATANLRELPDIELRAIRAEAVHAANTAANDAAAAPHVDTIANIDGEFERRDAEARFDAAYAASGFNPESAKVATSTEMRHLDSWAREARTGDAIELRAYSIAGGTSTGGDTVPTKVGGLIVPEVYTAGLANMVRRIVTRNGQPITHPKRLTHQSLVKVEELAQIPTSNGTLGKVETTPVKLGAMSYVSHELLADSETDVAALIRGGFEDAYRTSADAALVAGTNVNGSGVLGESAAVTTGSSTEVDPDEFIEAFYGTPKGSRDRAVWLMNAQTIEAVRKLKNTNDEYVLSGLSEGMPRILARPVIECPDMEDYGTAENKFAALVDPSALVIHVVRGLTVERSDDFKFDTDEAAFRGTVRMDAAVADSNGVTVMAHKAA